MPEGGALAVTDSVLDRLARNVAFIAASVDRQEDFEKLEGKVKDLQLTSMQQALLDAREAAYERAHQDFLGDLHKRGLSRASAARRLLTKAWPGLTVSVVAIAVGWCAKSS